MVAAGDAAWSLRFGFAGFVGATVTGFLTLFLAFLLRGQSIAVLKGTVLLGLVVVAAGVGNSLRNIVGNLLKDNSPEGIGLTVLAMGVTTAVFYSVVTVIAMGLMAGLVAQLAKPSYDALVQRDVPEVVRTSVFARSEAVIQIAWVVGGSLGIVVPLVPALISA